MRGSQRSIAIIGCGQAGLQLGIQLLSAKNYKVSIYTDRTAEQVRQGKIMSSQGMFSSALAKERALKLNFWDKTAPRNTSVTCSLALPKSNQRFLDWQGKVKPYQSIDQRLKYPHWMELFEKLGGHLYIQKIGPKELDAIAKQNELTIVTCGKGELSQLFKRHPKRSHFTVPQRALACLYVNSSQPISSTGVRVNILPDVGEFFTIPGLTHNGPSQMMLFEGVLNGPFDCWKKITSPQAMLKQAMTLLHTFVPWEMEQFDKVSLTDKNATLIGGYTPIIRYPTTTLPCGKSVLGLGDAVILNDPIAGQGANHACQSSYLYGECIIQREDKVFDEAWMKKVAELSWAQFGRPSTELSELLLMPPSAPIVFAFQAASINSTMADKFANIFDYPSTLSWLTDPKKNQKILMSMWE